MRRFLLALALLLCAAPSFAVSATLYSGTAKTSAGVAIDTATCTVYVASSGAVATIYSDTGGSSQVNPFTTASNGTYSVYLASGRYRIDCSNGSASFATFVTMPTQTTGGGTTVTAGAGVAVASGVVSLDYTPTLAGNPALAASTCQFSTTGIICEGSTANTIETLLTFADPAASDKTITVPATTGTVVLSTTDLPLATATVTGGGTVSKCARFDASHHLIEASGDCASGGDPFPALGLDVSLSDTNLFTVRQTGGSHYYIASSFGQLRAYLYDGSALARYDYNFMQISTKGAVGTCNSGAVGTHRTATDGSDCYCNGTAWTPTPLTGTCNE